MNKPAAFRWAWNDFDAWADPSMTRDRAARLLRAWRRSETQGRRDFIVWRQVANGAKHYRVTAVRSGGESGTMVIPFAH